MGRRFTLVLAGDGGHRAGSASEAGGLSSRPAMPQTMEEAGGRAIGLSGGALAAPRRHKGAREPLPCKGQKSACLPGMHLWALR